MSTALVAVPLPAGEVAVPVDAQSPRDAWATMILGHGAGAGRTHPFLVGLARGLAGEGVASARFDFPYVVAGRRMPGPAAHAVATWRAVAAWVCENAAAGSVWAGGKSYGGRMASIAAAEGAITPAGLVYLGYPLHPPGDPANPRVAHLPSITQPQLFVEGSNDPFIRPHEQLLHAVASCRDATIHWVQGGGHSFEVKGRTRAPDETGADLAPAVAAFLRTRQRPAA